MKVRVAGSSEAGGKTKDMKQLSGATLADSCFCCLQRPWCLLRTAHVRQVACMWRDVISNASAV